MKKKQFSLIPDFYRYLESKIGLKMRATFILLLIGITQSFALDGYAQNKRLTLNMSNVSIKSVLATIEDQSEFFFMYEASNVNVEKKVNVSVTEKTVPEILNDLFANTDITYKINNRQIALTSESLSSVGQQIVKVSGRVIDSSGSPLPGVTVVIKGKTTGTITDADGNFSLPNVPADAKLAFSFVGMKPVEVAVAGKSVINVTMVEETTAIDEVVAIGYGTVKKKDLSGAVGVIKTNQLDQSVNYTAANALQGKIAGVSITSNSGQPGSSAVIKIRGAGSINSNDPLIIIDNVPVQNILDNNKNITSGSLNNLNPTDIESVQVLKDASAAAIYGTRAANGVILITTKTGKKGAVKVDASADYGVQIAKGIDMCTSDEWVKVVNKIFTESNLDFSLRPEIAQHPEVTGKGTDWQDLIYRIAPVQNYSVGASGGSENLTYSTSLGYMNQEGVIKTTGADRLNLRLKSEFTKGRFKIGESVTISKSTKNTTWGVQQPAMRAIPAFAVYNSTGGFNITSQPLIGYTGNPLGLIDNNHGYNAETNIMVNLYGEVKLAEGLKYKCNVEVADISGNFSERQKKYDLGPGNKYVDNYVSNSMFTNKFWQVENTLSYEKIIAQKHSINAFIGQSASDSKYAYFSASRRGMPDGLWAMDAGSAANQSNGGNYKENTLTSYFGRVIYSFDNRYSFTGVFRRDGSSRFGKLNSWGNFPSLAANWNVANEPFFKNLATPVSELKIRGSWGRLGNQEIGDYTYMAAISSGLNFSNNAAVWNGAASTTLASANLKWEETETSNIGLDLGLWNGKLNYTLDVYQKTTTGILLPANLALSAGLLTNPIINAGDISNKGFEMTLSYNGHKGDFTYSVTGMLSHNVNEIVSLPKGTENLTGSKIGYPLYGFWYVKTDGLFRSQAEIDNYTHTNADGVVSKIQPYAKVGDQKFVDANDDGQITNGYVTDKSGDQQYCGSPFPKYEYGIRLDGSWKFIDISLYFQGVNGNKIFNGWRADASSSKLTYINNFTTELLNSYSFNPNSDIPRLSYDDLNHNFEMGNRCLEDGSYLRLKTAQIGFVLPERLAKKLSVSRCRLYLAGDNLVTFTSYKGPNPDIGNGGRINTGRDEIQYPLAKSYHMGLQLNF